MGSLNSNKVGLAGELRVMSELLLRGHNPAKSYLEDGADIILQNGLRLEVKSGHRNHFYNRPSSYHPNSRPYYQFYIRRVEANYDYMIIWCIDDDCFYVLPKETITRHIAIMTISDEATHKYAQYKNRWDLLVKEKGK